MRAPLCKQGGQPLSGILAQNTTIVTGAVCYTFEQGSARCDMRSLSRICMGADPQTWVLASRKASG